MQTTDQVINPNAATVKAGLIKTYQLKKKSGEREKLGIFLYIFRFAFFFFWERPENIGDERDSILWPICRLPNLKKSESFLPK